MRTRVDLDYGYKQRTRGRSRNAPSPLPRPGRRVNTCGPRVGHHGAGTGQHPRRRRRGRRGGLLLRLRLNSMSIPVTPDLMSSIKPPWGAFRYDVRIGGGGSHGKADIEFLLDWAKPLNSILPVEAARSRALPRRRRDHLRRRSRSSSLPAW